MASHLMGAGTPNLPVLACGAAFLARVSSDMSKEPCICALRVTNAVEVHSDSSRRGTEHRGGSMPIAIPDVSSPAIGPGDTNMHTGHMLNSSN